MHLFRSRACLALSLWLTLGLAGADPPLKTVLKRAGAYALDYHERFAALVAEERYIQRTGPDPLRPLMGRPLVEQERILRSDYVIVPNFARSGSWTGVRDVFEVDGQPVNADRDRLRALLQETTRPLAERLRALADLQAKHNLGDVYRTINVPTLPLEFLLQDRQPRFRFKSNGPVEFRGTRAMIVTFTERDRPTIIRTPDGRDVASSGTFWIDPASGAVLRTELRLSPPRSVLRTVIVVGYMHHDRLDMLLPDDMNEMYLSGRTRIDGHATYSNYRRFETDVRIK